MRIRHSLQTIVLALALAPAALAQSWAPLPSGTTADLSDVHFLSPSVGFAVADGGLLLSTTNGGATWTARTLNAALDNQGIAFNAAGTVGVIVTDDGPVFRTTDGGATWAGPIATGMGDGRAAIAWGTDAVVWVAGRDGDAAVSSDAGATWTYRPTGSAERTEGLAAVGTQTAWVVGRGGEIRVTTNGGATWAPQASGVGSDLNDIQMLDAQTGYIAGSSDVVLKTTNGGATWTNVSTGNAGGDGLFFLDASTGWVVGDLGEVWHTTNGGATWALQPSGTGVNLDRVHFPSPTRGFAVGEAGVIVRFDGATTAGEAGPAAAGLALAVAPNPVGAAGVVTLTLDRAQTVAVDIYDALGRRVAVVHDGAMSAGPHRLAFDAAPLAPGLYVVRVAGSGGAAVSRRVAVAR